MSALLESVDLTVALAAAHVAVDALQAGGLTSYSDDEVTSLLRETERLRHRLAAVDHAQILDLERRGMALTVGARTVPRLLCHLLDIDPGEARARHRAAEAAGSRRALSGELLTPPTRWSRRPRPTVCCRHVRRRSSPTVWRRCPTS